MLACNVIVQPSGFPYVSIRIRLRIVSGSPWMGEAGWSVGLALAASGAVAADGGSACVHSIW